MKGLIFCTLSLLSIGCAAQIRFKVLAGYNDASLPEIGGGYDGWDQNSSANSFHAGVAAEIPLGKNWFLEPALLYFGNGAHIVNNNVNPGGGRSTEEFTLRLYYLRLPVNLLYKIKLGRSFHVIAGAGLYVSRGLWGTQKGYDSPTYNGNAFRPPPVQVIDNNIKFTNDIYPSNLTFNPYDFGYSFLAGLEWKHLQLIPAISNGLIKAYTGSGYNLKNSAFSISLAYKFGVRL